MSLFSDESPWDEPLAPGAQVLHHFAVGQGPEVLIQIDKVCQVSTFRHLVTPGGLPMSVAMTNCGVRGWFSDAKGYRYTDNDPLTGQPWPPMPATFLVLCQSAARVAGYPDFCPDACLINRYLPGNKLSLHQDNDEQDRQAPIVSVSLGLSAVFQFGGATRSAPVKRLVLEHGDVVVWGRESRFYYHGIQPLKPASHPLTGAVRFNLTFRKTR